jgi:hypothetical protein
MVETTNTLSDTEASNIPNMGSRGQTVDFNLYGGLGKQDSFGSRDSTGSFNLYGGLGEKDETDIPEQFQRPEPYEYDEDDRESVENAERLSYEELAADREYIEMLNEYMINRLGEKDGKRPGESNEAFIKRFVAHVRRFELNSIKLSQQVSWVRNATDEERMEFGHLYSQLDKLPSFYQAGGAGFAPALRDIGASLILDPLNLIGFGAGKAASSIATRGVIQALKNKSKKDAIKIAASTARKVAGAGIGAEVALGALQQRGVQEIEILTDQRTGVGYGEIAGGALLGAGVGITGAYLSGALGRKTAQRRGEAEVARQEAALVSLKERDPAAVQEAVRRTQKATEETATGVFDLAEGRRTLEQLGDVDSSGMTQPEFNLELMKRVGKVVTEAVSELATNGKLGQMIDGDTKASEVIGLVTGRLARVRKVDKQGNLLESAEEISEQTRKLLREDGDDILSKLDVADEDFDDVLEAAISRAGISVEQFVNAMGESYSNAGSFLSTAGKVGRILKGLSRLDPKLEKLLDQSSDAEKSANILASAMEFIRRLDRNRRAFMVSQIATTVRNVATGGARLTLETAADLIESTIYQFGRGADAARFGAPGAANRSYRDILRDARGKFVRLATVTQTRSIADELLKHNRRLASKIDRTLQEATEDEAKQLHAIAKGVNVLNIAQDQFFRRGIFVNSVEKKLKRAGIIVNDPKGPNQFANIDEFVASGKTLPSKMLAHSIEESLEFTFSKMPSGNSIAGAFVRFVEKVGPLPVPVGTIAFPFARFMANAIDFQTKFSPLGFINSAGRYHSARKLDKMAKLSGKLEDNVKAEVAFKQAREDASRAIVGTAALSAAVYYRANNQDIEFYEFKTFDGGTADARPLFPFAPYLAVADFLVKLSTGNLDKLKIKDIVASVTGVQARTGASSYVLDKFADLLGGQDNLESRKLKELGGRLAAEYAGSFTTPARIVRDIVASYDTDEATLRDARQTDLSFINALTTGLAKDIPGASKYLPALESPTRSRNLYREQSLLGAIGAPRYTSKRNPVESELLRLGIPGYTIGARTGNRTADSLANRVMGGIVERNIADIIATDEYQEMTDVRKSSLLSRSLREAKNTATQIARFDARQESNAEGVGATVFDQGDYSRLLTARQRKLADEYYLEKYGKTVLEMAEEEPSINHYTQAVRLGRELDR